MALFAVLGFSAAESSFAATRKPAAHKRRASVKPRASKNVRGRRSRGRRAAARSYQQAPTPARYREIQQAMADRGYFKGPVNGEWGPDSVDALKRFQAGQNLTPDGKLGSLSLIALGLGPKRLTAQSGAHPPEDRQ
jgi:murein L,D-transpeptidase YcbB/YkuD